MHTTSGHDAWRKEHDAKQAAGPNGRRQYQKQADPQPDAANAAKKLALSESLRTAMCTQAGLSTDLFDRLWAEADRDSGKD